MKSSLFLGRPTEVIKRRVVNGEQMAVELVSDGVKKKTRANFTGLTLHGAARTDALLRCFATIYSKFEGWN